MRHIKTNTFLGIALSVLLLSACDMTSPSQVNVRPIQIKDGMRTELVSAQGVDYGRVNIVADTYHRGGDGALMLNIPFREGKKADAIKVGQAYASAFKKRGIEKIEVDYVPVNDALYQGNAVVLWHSVTAAAPEDCGHIPGFQGTDTLEDMQKYAVGCETERAISQMVADPSDLMGKGGTPDEDSRRQGAVVEKYKAGTPNQKIEGLNASTVSSGG